MRLSKRLLAGIFVVTATGHSDASGVARALRVDAPAGSPQGTAPKVKFSRAQVQVAAGKVLPKLTSSPQTLKSLASLLPDTAPALISAAIELMLAEGTVEELLGSGTPTDPTVYLDSETLKVTIGKIQTALSGGGKTMDSVKRAMPESKPELVEGVIAALVEGGDVATEAAPNGVNNYVWRARQRVG